jgi:hypothetical protein
MYKHQQPLENRVTHTKAASANMMMTCWWHGVEKTSVTSTSLKLIHTHTFIQSQTFSPALMFAGRERDEE